MNAAQAKAEYLELEEQLLSLEASRAEAIRNLREELDEHIDQLRERVIQAQKDYGNAEAAEALVGTPDAEATAQRLGLTLPDTQPA